MAKKIKFFKCLKCKEYSPFDIRAAVATKSFLAVCENCDREWIGSLTRQTCCRIDILFASVEPSGSRSLKSPQSFSKR